MANDNGVASISLDGLEDSRRALLELLEGMRRTLYLYTPLVRSDLYGDPEVIDTIRSRVADQPKLRLHLVLPLAREWRNDCPRLARLGERLTSTLLLRTPNREEMPHRPELGQAFAIVDEQAWLRFSDPRRLIGSYESQPSERMKELLELFHTLWSRSQTDPDLRWLGI
ncbi:MAG TPA: hypothetical protein DEP36_01945 [Gammaproteobacteria bacterium]|nr:hypothetical protein [Gammaproteobacteria bacterium]HRF42849.1 hypothetical protein [Candidatus Competibacteraceae bacterium]